MLKQPLGTPLRTNCIAAASVVAKVTRDAVMIELATRHPGFGFDQHKGYGTQGHLSALAEFGPTVQHRLTWAPVLAVVGSGVAPRAADLAGSPGAAAGSGTVPA